MTDGGQRSDDGTADPIWARQVGDDDLWPVASDAEAEPHAEREYRPEERPSRRARAVREGDTTWSGPPVRSEWPAAEPSSGTSGEADVPASGSEPVERGQEPGAGGSHAAPT